jgi:transcriptional regulator with XRE-family HTH domain
MQNKTLGSILKAYRLAKFPTQPLRHSASLMGINFSYLFRIEEDSHKPSDDVLKLIVDTYELTPIEQRDVFILAHSSIFAKIINNAPKDESLEKVLFRRAKDDNGSKK